MVVIMLDTSNPSLQPAYPDVDTSPTIRALLAPRCLTFKPCHLCFQLTNVRHCVEIIQFLALRLSRENTISIPATCFVERLLFDRLYRLGGTDGLRLFDNKLFHRVLGGRLFAFQLPILPADST